jgi:hypothetical protein
LAQKGGAKFVFVPTISMSMSFLEETQQSHQQPEVQSRGRRQANSKQRRSKQTVRGAPMPRPRIKLRAGALLPGAVRCRARVAGRVDRAGGRWASLAPAAVAGEPTLAVDDMLHRAEAALDVDVGAPRVANTERSRLSRPLPHRVASARSEVPNDAVYHLLALERWILGDGRGVTRPELAAAGGLVLRPERGVRGAIARAAVDFQVLHPPLGERPDVLVLMPLRVGVDVKVIKF